MRLALNPVSDDDRANILKEGQEKERAKRKRKERARKKKMA